METPAIFTPPIIASSTSSNGLITSSTIAPPLVPSNVITTSLGSIIPLPTTVSTTTNPALSLSSISTSTSSTSISSSSTIRPSSSTQSSPALQSSSTVTTSTKGSTTSTIPQNVSQKATSKASSSAQHTLSTTVHKIFPVFIVAGVCLLLAVIAVVVILRRKHQRQWQPVTPGRSSNSDGGNFTTPKKRARAGKEMKQARYDAVNGPKFGPRQQIGDYDYQDGHDGSDRGWHWGVENSLTKSHPITGLGVGRYKSRGRAQQRDAKFRIIEDNNQAQQVQRISLLRNSESKNSFKDGESPEKSSPLANKVDQNRTSWNEGDDWGQTALTEGYGGPGQRMSSSATHDLVGTPRSFSDSIKLPSVPGFTFDQRKAKKWVCYGLVNHDEANDDGDDSIQQTPVSTVNSRGWKGSDQSMSINDDGRQSGRQSTVPTSRSSSTRTPQEAKSYKAETGGLLSPHLQPDLFFAKGPAPTRSIMSGSDNTYSLTGAAFLVCSNPTPVFEEMDAPYVAKDLGDYYAGFSPTHETSEQLEHDMTDLGMKSPNVFYDGNMTSRTATQMQQEHQKALDVVSDMLRCSRRPSLTLSDRTGNWVYPNEEEALQEQERDEMKSVRNSMLVSSPLPLHSSQPSSLKGRVSLTSGEMRRRVSGGGQAGIAL